jgi:hypothetical protein
VRLLTYRLDARRRSAQAALPEDQEGILRQFLLGLLFFGC